MLNRVLLALIVTVVVALAFFSMHQSEWAKQRKLAFLPQPNAALVNAAGDIGPVTGLPTPRFVSLKSNEINMRAGPGFRYPIEWVFWRRYLPVEILDEFEHWRLVQTHDGMRGWVHRQGLTGKRSIRVQRDNLLLRKSASTNAMARAKLMVGMVGQIEQCNSQWCSVTVETETGGSLSGWLTRRHLYGLYESETI